MDTEMILVRRVALVASVLGALVGLYAGVSRGIVPGFSVVLGTAVGLGNFWALAWLLRKVISAGADTDKLRAGVLLVLKMVLLYGIIWALFSRSWVSAGWFMVGVTGCVVSLLVCGMWPSDPTASSNDTDKGKP